MTRSDTDVVLGVQAPPTPCLSIHIYENWLTKNEEVMDDFKPLRRNLPDTMAVGGLSWLSEILRVEPDAFS
jgi:hypothetical protein